MFNLKLSSGYDIFSAFLRKWRLSIHLYIWLPKLTSLFNTFNCNEWKALTSSFQFEFYIMFNTNVWLHSKDSKNFFKIFSSSMYASFTVTSDGVADLSQLSRLATKRMQLISLSQSCTSVALALMSPHKKNQASSDKEKVCGR